MTQFPFYPHDRAERLALHAAEYTFTQDEPTPWTPLRKSLRDCRACLVTTAGLRLKTQHEFRADRARGSAEFREISLFAHRRDLAFDFTNYDPREAEKDLNVIVPVDRLKELVDDRVLAGVHETFFSFYGLCQDVAALRESAREAARRAQCDVAFLFPANLVCNQTVSIVSREFEQAGISTVTLVTVREIAAQVRVPRPLFINHPFGRTLGRAGDRAGQRDVLDEMVKALRTHDRPARMTDLPMKWTEMLDD
jgi:D-proline reductase (dithiol) PrdB